MPAIKAYRIAGQKSEQDGFHRNIPGLDQKVEMLSIKAKA